jgi:hypothetical protein
MPLGGSHWEGAEAGDRSASADRGLGPAGLRRNAWDLRRPKEFRGTRRETRTKNVLPHLRVTTSPGVCPEKLREKAMQADDHYR